MGPGGYLLNLNSDKEGDEKELMDPVGERLVAQLVLTRDKLKGLIISLDFPRAEWVLYQLMGKVLPSYSFLPDIEAKLLQNSLVWGTF